MIQGFAYFLAYEKLRPRDILGPFERRRRYIRSIVAFLSGDAAIYFTFERRRRFSTFKRRRRFERRRRYYVF